MRAAAMVLLVLAARGAAAGFEVRVVDTPRRLGDAGAQRTLEGSIPGLRVVPTGAGELVLSGDPRLLDAAEALLSKLDRPPREVIVEVTRGASSWSRDRSARLGVGVGGDAAATTLRRTQGRSRGRGTRTLRLQEGSSARLFVGGEVPVSGGFGRVRTLSAGSSVRLRLVSVRPGEGAVLEVDAGEGSFGAPGPAGPTIRRERVGTRVFARFGVPTLLGSFGGGETSSSRGGGLRGTLSVEEEVARDPNARSETGGGGRPTGRLRRRPVRGSVSAGGGRSRSGGGGVYTVVVREVE